MSKTDTITRRDKSETITAREFDRRFEAGEDIVTTILPCYSTMASLLVVTRDGDEIEVASIDAELGAVFYIFDIPHGDSRVVVERARRCMNCHANEDTLQVPGLSVKSVAPGPGGGSLGTLRPGQSGHTQPLAERFGG